MPIYLSHEEHVNSYIPEAKRLATKQLMKKKKLENRIRLHKGEPQTYTHCFFSEYFHAAMNQLTKETGLRV